MRISQSEQDVAILQAGVRFEMNAAPTVRCLLARAIDLLTAQQWELSRSRVKLNCENLQFEFTAHRLRNPRRLPVVGFEPNTSNHAALPTSEPAELWGELVVDKLTSEGDDPLNLGWFEETPNCPGTAWLIFQRGKSEAIVSCLQRFLDGKLAPPDNPPADVLLPNLACILRSATSSNHEFLGRLIGALRLGWSGLLGWDIDPKGKKPLRLVTTAEPKDATADWHPVNSIETSESGHCWTARFSRLISREYPADHTAQLQSYLNGHKEAGADFLLPGSVSFHGHQYYCLRTDYRLEPDGTLTGFALLARPRELQFEYPTTLPGVHIQGTTSGWEGTEWLKLKPVDSWVMGDKGIMTAPAEPLVAEVRTPFGARDGLGGFYVKYQKDTVYAQISAGVPPVVSGSRQTKNEDLEKNDASLAGKHLLMKSEDASIDLSTNISVATGGDISTAGQNIASTSQAKTTLTATGDAKISSSATVELNAGAKLKMQGQEVSSKAETEHATEAPQIKSTASVKSTITGQIVQIN